jgi:hypothetical protein
MRIIRVRACQIKYSLYYSLFKLFGGLKKPVSLNITMFNNVSGDKNDSPNPNPGGNKRGIGRNGRIP